MKRLAILLTGAAVALALGAFTGCSSDDSNPTGGGGGISGDLNDPNFLAVQDLMDQADTNCCGWF